MCCLAGAYTQLLYTPGNKSMFIHDFVLVPTTMYLHVMVKNYAFISGGDVHLTFLLVLTNEMFTPVKK